MVPIKLLHELFKYRPASGKLYWVSSRTARIKIGDEVGTPDPDGYLVVNIDYANYKVHRIIWAMVYGKWPKGQLDHINGVTYDNRIENLREANHSQNQANSKDRKNLSGRRGVYWHSIGKKWAARITVNGKAKHLGLFSNIEDASAAYSDAAKTAFGEFRRNT